MLRRAGLRPAAPTSPAPPGRPRPAPTRPALLAVGLAAALVLAGRGGAAASGAAVRRAAPGPTGVAVDTSGQQFTVQVTSGFQPVLPRTVQLTFTMTNQTAGTEGIDIKDQQLSAWALIPPADQATFEQALDAVGDYGAVVCAGQSFGSVYTNPLPAGSCGVSLDVGPDSLVTSDDGGQTEVVAAHTTVEWSAATTNAPGLPLADITSVLIGFSPSYAETAVLPVEPSSIPALPLPPSPVPSGTSTCRARPLRFTRRPVALQPGDRVTRATLTTGGPARQLQVVVRFDGPVTTGSDEPLYEFGVPLRSHGTVRYSLETSFRRGMDPAAEVLTHGAADLGVDAALGPDTLTLRTPLLGLPNLRAPFQWTLTETVLDGPHQTQAFTIACGPVST